MGLDTTHDCWHGSYGAFSRFRDKLAEAAGYKLTTHNGYPCVVLDWERFTEANMQGEWEQMPEDPLLILIAHSDCDGLIKREHCSALADRIEALLPLLPTEDVPGHIGNWRKKTQTFVDGLRAAASAGEDVEFY